MSVLTEALRYREKGFSVFPVNPENKKPFFSWSEYQKRAATEGELRQMFSKFPAAMIALATGRISDVVAVDIDTDEGQRAIEPFLPGNLETPTAKTPRGGTHYYFRHSDGFPTKAGVFSGVDLRGDGGYIIAPPSVNSKNKSYRWAISPDDSDFLPVPEALRTHIKYLHSLSALPPSQKDVAIPPQTQQSATGATLSFEQGRRDESLFYTAYRLLKGGATPDNTLICLKIIASQCNPPFPEKELNAKIESALKRVQGKERNLTAEIREWISATNGNFSATSLYQDATIATSEDKHKARTILGRLVQEGLIERDRQRNGWYRRVESDCEVMDFLNAPTTEFPITLPLGASDLCKLYPGNIIIVAGAKSAGKTAFLLNLAKLNIGRLPMDFLNSEMGETELRLRLDAHNDTSLHKWAQGVRFIARGRDWWDVIQPENKITIIDYMEPPEDQIYMVGSYIRKIHEKMGGKGLCIIGLQKQPGRDTGRGATFSMDKARLYLALDYNQEKRCNQIKIVDAKAWKKENPRGLMREYKLHNGANYEPLSTWHM